MKKNSFFLCVLFAASMVITNAQENQNVHLRPVGFGLHIEQFKLNDIYQLNESPANKLIITINPTQNFRIEPEIGFRTSKDKETEAKGSAVFLGVGAFGMYQKGNLNIYAGGRIELGFVSSEYVYTSGSSSSGSKRTTDIKRTMFGPALGGEYFFADNFSFGGELSIYYMVWKRTVTPSNSNSNYENDNNDENSGFSSNTGLFARFYF